MEIDDSLDYWGLSDTLTLVNAALLIAGINPAKCRFENRSCLLESNIYDDNNNKLLSAKFRAVYSSILLAANSESLRIYSWDRDDESQTTVKVEELRQWLFLRDFYPEFFFPKNDSGNIKDQKYAFQDQNHPHYAPKLAAAVAAWEAVSEAAPSTSVKATLAQWLQENGKEYVKKNGEITKEFIEQASSVANWEPKGGAPAKKTKVSLSAKKETKKSNQSVCSVPLDDAEMPF
ncbi:hypothetical protein MCU_01391 [Bartonella elizabethae Re6043vi]|uniref:DUF1376 domain-containing protein n=1 Tax=Bartonella elizabethae Re6043vi TaxID=1094554 RepID=A0ABN0GIX3_BAREL|nr:hypothetical protein [Bartonella elizabethae]EJF82594.1 hypothetical protein MCU_01391 [Bartonella elizabethae Re6043vi]